MNTIKLPATKLQAAAALSQMKGFIGRSQLATIDAGVWSEERQFFYDKLVEMAEIITTMPVTYQTDGQGDQAIAQLHYFTAGCDWYITERDCETEKLQAFGKANLGHGAELGYISIVEVLTCGAELDLYWTPKPLGRCPA